MYQWTCVKRKPRTYRLGIPKGLLLFSQLAELKKRENGSWDWKVFLNNDLELLQTTYYILAPWGNEANKQLANNAVIQQLYKIYGTKKLFPDIKYKERMY